MSRLEKAKQLEKQIAEATEQLSVQLSMGHTDQFKELLDFYSQHFHKYSWANSMLIRMQMPLATTLAGMKQWNAMGGRVRKGEQAIWIRAPRFKKQEDPRTGNEERKLIGFLAVPVWDVSQLENAEEILPQHRMELPGDHGILYSRLVHEAKLTGISVEESRLAHGMGGYATGKLIVINEDNPASVKLQTLIHECAHVLLHTSSEKQVSRSQAEIEAESVVYVLGRLLGFEVETSADYILNWDGSGDKLQESMQAVHYAVKTIFAWVEMSELIATS